MSSYYFSNYPTILYTDFSDSPNNLKVATNLTSIWAVNESLNQNQFAFNTLSISDNERPEVIASKQPPYGYSSPHYHWAILRFNNVVNPYTDWVMSYNTFNKFIEQKYSSPEYADTANTGVSGMEWSQSNVKHYYSIEKVSTSDGNYTKEVIAVNSADYANVLETTTQVTLSDGEIITVEVYKETETYYEYETKQNEDKRNIKLLKSEIVHSMLNEIENVFNK